MNIGYKTMLAELGRPVTEKTKTALTVASQQFYQMPPDYLYLKSVTITSGGIAYPVAEIEDQEMWNYLNARSTQTANLPEWFFIRPGFGLSGAEIGFYPTPSTASNTITMVYEANDRDLAITKYTTGTVAVTNGSATVTGTSTTFTAAMVGRYFQTTADGFWYRIATFTSTTVIVLENVFEGTTATGAAYTIAEAFHVPEEMQILPVYFALAHYYGMKRDETQEGKYWQLYTNGLLAGKKRHGTKTRSGTMRQGMPRTGWPRATPPYFPRTIS